MNQLLTKEGCQQLFDQLHIQAGATVLLQASDLSFVIGQEEQFLEALIEWIGPTGTLIVPTLTQRYLDPSITKEVAYVSWPTVREQMPGFSRQTAWANALACQLLRLKGSIRGMHPEANFVYWGQSVSHDVSYQSSEPISFTGALSVMKRAKAVNLLVDVAEEKALLLDCLAHEASLGVLVAKKAKLKRQKAWLAYYDRQYSEQEKTAQLKRCKIRSEKVDGHRLTALSK